MPKSKNTILKSRLRDCSEAYIVVNGFITAAGQGADTRAISTDRNNKQVIYKSSAPFTHYIYE